MKSPEIPERFNLAEHLLTERLREGRGDRIALRTDDRSWRYDEVDRLSRRFGLSLRELGVRPEERVMLALPDGPEMVGALFGTLRIGAVAVMVNPRLGTEEISALYPYVRPRTAVVHADSLPTFAEARTEQWPHTFLVCGGAGDGHAEFEPLSRSLGDELETFPTHRDDPAIWLFSGGTTGRPKAVVQSHRSFANTTELYARRTLEWSEDDITLSVPKLFFGYATGSNLFFPFSVGGSAVLFPEHPTPEAVFDHIERHRPTILVNVPTVIGRMVEHPSAPSRDLSSLRFATSAGEPLPAALHRRWTELFGVELLDGLGTAEMWHVFLTNRPGDVHPGTLGRVVEGFEIAVRDAEGRDLPEDQVGSLWVRGDSRALGYWQEHDKSMASFRGRWFVGGDLVRRDEHGVVTYCGRSDDVVKVGGKWLVPREVEALLYGHPEVEECAVVTVRDAAGLTKPWAFVFAPGADPGLANALRELTLERLQPYKHPRRVILVDEMPRTHLGKIDRGALARRARRLLDDES